MIRPLSKNSFTIDVTAAVDIPRKLGYFRAGKGFVGEKQPQRIQAVICFCLKERRIDIIHTVRMLLPVLWNAFIKNLNYLNS